MQSSLNNKEAHKVNKALSNEMMKSTAMQQQQQEQLNKQQEQPVKEISFTKFKTLAIKNTNKDVMHNELKSNNVIKDRDELVAVALAAAMESRKRMDLAATPFITNEVSKITAATTRKSATNIKAQIHKCAKATTTTNNNTNNNSNTKHVYFNLPQKLETGLNKSLAINQPPIKLDHKHIIFNGTYPIDLPFQSRFNQLDYDAEANASIGQMKYAQSLNDYDFANNDDDEDDDDDDDEDDADDDEDYDYEDDDDYDNNSNNILKHLGIIKTPLSPKTATTTQNKEHNNVWSMEELIANPSIPLNYKKMCNEVEQSLGNFEKYLDSKAKFKSSKKLATPRTYGIDGPLFPKLENKKKI